MKEVILRPSKERGFNRRFKVGLLSFLTAWLIGFGLDYKKVFRAYDQSDLDHYTRNSKQDDRYSERITVIEVDEDDYRELFGSMSPLRQSTLVAIVKKILDYRPPPRVLGVDLLTGDWPAPLDVQDFQDKRVVWARDGKQAANDTEVPLVRLRGVAGHSQKPKAICAAPPFLPVDSDRGVRAYYTGVHATEGDSKGMKVVQTMPVLLASVFPDNAFDCDAAGHAQEKLIRFFGKWHRIPGGIPASSVLRDMEWALSPKISNRIVLLGATYDAARDRYWTPSGHQDGVYILAHAVETELSGGPRRLQPGENAGIALVSGLLFYIAAFVLKQPFDLILSAIAPVVFAFVAGWMLYDHFGFFMGLASSMLGVPIGVAVEHYAEHLDLVARLHSAPTVNTNAKE